MSGLRKHAKTFKDLLYERSRRVMKKEGTEKEREKESEREERQRQKERKKERERER